MIGVRRGHSTRGSRGTAVLSLQLSKLLLVVSLQSCQFGAQAVRRIILFGQLLLQCCQLLLVVSLQLGQSALIFSALGFTLVGVGVLQLLQLLVITLFQLTDLVGKLIRVGRAGAGGAAGAGAVLLGLVLGDQLCKRLLVLYAQQLLFQIRHLDDVLGFIDLLFQLCQPGGAGGGFLLQLRGCKLVPGIQHLLFEVCQILLVPCSQNLLFSLQHPGVILGQLCLFQLCQLLVVLRIQLLLFSRTGLLCVLGIQLRLCLCLFGFGLLSGLPFFSILAYLVGVVKGDIGYRINFAVPKPCNRVVDLDQTVDDVDKALQIGTVSA